MKEKQFTWSSCSEQNPLANKI